MKEEVDKIEKKIEKEEKEIEHKVKEFQEKLETPKQPGGYPPRGEAESYIMFAQEKSIKEEVKEKVEKIEEKVKEKVEEIKEKVKEKLDPPKSPYEGGPPRGEAKPYIMLADTPLFRWREVPDPSAPMPMFPSSPFEREVYVERDVCTVSIPTSKNEIMITVSSNGCTDKTHFRFVILEAEPEEHHSDGICKEATPPSVRSVKFIRIKRDDCKMMDHNIRLIYSFEELGIKPNPIETSWTIWERVDGLKWTKERSFGSKADCLELLDIWCKQSGYTLGGCKKIPDGYGVGHDKGSPSGFWMIEKCFPNIVNPNYLPEEKR